MSVRTDSTHGATGRAPGKVILLGEHAVVYGALAIAGSIDRHVRVSVRRADGASSVAPSALPRISEALHRAGTVLEVDTSQLEAIVDGDLPQAVGLGSSAAFSVALVRAVAAYAQRRTSAATICAAAFELEKLFHGSPSGIDNSAVTYGRLIAFRRGNIRSIPMAAPLDMVIAMAASPRATRAAVASVRARRDRDPGRIDAIFAAIDALAREAEPALAAGQRAVVGRLMRCNHELLRTLGVSTPELDAMVDLAHRHGALGAKLTGGGGGGAVVCVPPDDSSALIDAFSRAGWRAFATRVSASSRKESHAAVDRRAAAYASAEH